MYPLALVDIDGLVVVFTQFGIGTVFQSDGGYEVGYHSDTWDMNVEWTAFQGTIMANFA